MTFDATSEMEARIQLLEKQVAGLMATVNSFYGKYSMQSWGIPKPDQFLQAESIDAKDKVIVAAPIARAKQTQNAAGQTATALPNDHSTLKPFQYSVLDSKTSEVRLLKILASKTTDEPISCEMIVKPLPDSPYGLHFPFFMPLSYTWGTLKKTESIKLNGKSFLVTKNLHVALNHFRNAGLSKILPPAYSRSDVSNHYWWIDAICINQDDLDERKEQVALMTRLYRLARVAHVWLGEEGGDSPRAMRMVRELSRDVPEREQIDFVKTPSGQTHQYRGPGTVPEKIPEAHIYPETTKKLNYRALVQLYRREWWSRVWILQEIALPGDVSIHCGDEVCTWAQLMKATSLLVHVIDEYQLSSFQSPDIVNWSSVASIFQRGELLSRIRNAVQSRLHLKPSSKKSPYLPLVNALLYAKNCEATDPRDKVYAILPLVSPAATTLAADYRKTKIEVYNSTALDLSAKSLDFLSLCQYVEGDSKDLPSWVPNFSQAWTYYPMLATEMLDEQDDEHEPFLADYDANDGVLRVQGIVLDTLSQLDNPHITANSSKAEVASAKGNWEAFVAKHDYGRDVTHLHNVLRWYSSAKSLYWPLYKVGYTGTLGDEADLSLRNLGRQLAPQTEKFEMQSESKLGWYRNFFAGRQFVVTKAGHAGIVPAAAKHGDKVCKLNGSAILFVLRKGADDRWIVIGDSYFQDTYSAYNVSQMRDKPDVQEMLLS